LYLTKNSANIPVSSRLCIPGGSSPFLAPSSIHESTNHGKGDSFFPSAPNESPVIPGETILDYIPPHPALSNPRKVHRYLISLLETHDGSPMDTNLIKEKLNQVQEDNTSLNKDERMKMTARYF
jgi:hypothetical protein